MIIAPAINTGTFSVAPQDAGVASATVTVGQMLGGSVGTSRSQEDHAGNQGDDPGQLLASPEPCRPMWRE